jgi:hypothetical protein
MRGGVEFHHADARGAKAGHGAPAALLPCGRETGAGRGVGEIAHGAPAGFGFDKFHHAPQRQERRGDAGHKTRRDLVARGQPAKRRDAIARGAVGENEDRGAMRQNGRDQRQGRAGIGAAPDGPYAGQGGGHGMGLPGAFARGQERLDAVGKKHEPHPVAAGRDADGKHHGSQRRAVRDAARLPPHGHGGAHVHGEHDRAGALLAETFDERPAEPGRDLPVHGRHVVAGNVFAGFLVLDARAAVGRAVTAGQGVAGQGVAAETHAARGGEQRFRLESRMEHLGSLHAAFRLPAGPAGLRIKGSSAGARGQRDFA